MQDPSYFGLQYNLRQTPIPFSADEIRRLPEGVSGVYAIWIADEPIYIGMAKRCLRRRLLSHLNNADRSKNPCLYAKIGKYGIFNETIAAFTTVPVPTRALVPELEKQIIQAWRPECNRNYL